MPILLLLVCVARIFCVARVFAKNQVITILTDQGFSNIEDCVNNGFCGDNRHQKLRSGSIDW